MNRKERRASDIFYKLYCINSYYIDFKSHTCIELSTNTVMSFDTLFDKYISSCYYKRFYNRELTRFFTDIKNNVGERSIAITQNINGKITPIRLELVINDNDRFEGHLFEMKTDNRIDQLTGLYNADEFQLDMNRISKQLIDKDLAILTFDINGLKRKNDECGHPIGDELIKGAAYCINATYYTCGKCYRTGGDEFTVIAYSPLNELLRKKEYFDILTSQYKTENIDEISISYGCASIQEYPKSDIFDLRAKSDEALYTDKENYYEKVKVKEKENTN